MTVAHYAAAITFGPYTWNITSEDAADPDVPNVLAGLDFGWNMPEADLLPAQPDAQDAGFRLLVPDIDDLPEAKIGAAVSIEISLSATVLFSFYGRATDVQAVPADRGGMYMDVVAMDYTVDERRVGVNGWTFAPYDGRIEDVFADAGTAPPNWVLDTPPTLPGWDPKPTTIPEYLATILPSLIEPKHVDPVAGTTPARFILAPLIDGTTPDATQNFALDKLTNDIDTVPVGTFGATAGGDYGVVIDPDPANLVLDSDFVRLGVSWVQRKYGRFDQLQVTTPSDGFLKYGTDRGPYTIVAQLDLVYDPFLFDPSLYMQNNADVGNTWEVSKLTYELSRDIEAGLDPSTLTVGWMPNHAAPEFDPERTSCYLRPIVVTDIPETQNPGSGGFYSGQLRGARLKIEQHRLKIEFSVRRTIPNATASGDVLTSAGLAASALAAVRVDQLDPDFTVYDYRLVKEA